MSNETSQAVLSQLGSKSIQINISPILLFYFLEFSFQYSLELQDEISNLPLLAKDLKEKEKLLEELHKFIARICDRFDIDMSIFF